MMAKRILVPVEMNAHAEAMVPVVAALARDSGGTVRLLSVQPAPQTRFDEPLRKLPLYGFDGALATEFEQRVLAYAHSEEQRIEADTLTRLRELEPLLDGVPIERAVRFGGDVVEEIAREAEAFDADLVAVTERRRPWWRPALARIVDRLRLRLRVPVLALSGGAR
jgi:nucleotide-binding universal stress UspA family protein